MTDEDSDHGDLDQAGLQMLMQDSPNSLDMHDQVDCLNM